MLDDFSIYYIIYILITILACFKILLDTDSPTKTIAYILFVIALPIVGIILYFAVGANHRKQKLYEKKLKIDKDAYPELEQRSLEYSRKSVQYKSDELGHFHNLSMYAAQDILSSTNNSVELLINGENKFPKFIESLRRAKHHIHIEYYIYDNDTIGNEIAKILIQKAQEGVKVRFIYDDFGSRNIRKNIVKELRDAGVEAYPFYEINFIHFANRLNYRNHRKILVVDGLEGYIGGINVSDKYINQSNSTAYWRDTHLKITGISVLNLQSIFLTDWNFCSGQQIVFSEEYFHVDLQHEDYGDKLVQIVPSGPDSKQPRIMHTYIQAILLAKKEILITTPYFIPDKSFLDALIIAKTSGVDVKILVPKTSDSYLVKFASHAFYHTLLNIGIEIYEYTKGFVHAKTMVCDEYISVIGTANLDNRSFDLNFEVNAIVYDAELANQMKEQYLKDMEYTEQVTLDNWNDRPLYARTVDKIAQLFAPLL